jgi:hypothetical protein
MDDHLTKMVVLIMNLAEHHGAGVKIFGLFMMLGLFGVYLAAILLNIFGLESYFFIGLCH